MTRMMLAKVCFGIVLLSSCTALRDIGLGFLHDIVPDELSIDFDRIDGHLSLQELFERERQTKAKKGVSDGEYDIALLQQGGSYVEEVTFTFRPEKAVYTIDDYIITFTSQNETIVPNADRIEGPEIAEGSVEGSTYYNVTYTVIYDHFPGVVDLDFKAELKPESNVNPDVDPEIYEQTFTRTVAGMAIYYFDENGDAVIVSGEDRSYTVDYSSQDFQQDFFVYAQFPERGTSSVTPGGDTGGLVIDSIVGDYYKQFDFNSEEDCTTGGIWDGSQVDLTEPLSRGCGLSFATNDSPGVDWTGWHFGLLLNRYRGGDVSLDLLWDSFTAGTGLEDSGPLSQTLNIQIRGNPPPIVYHISPDIEFIRFGGEELHLWFFNSETDEEMSYFLQFPPVPISAFLPIEGSFTTFDNFTSKVTVLTNRGEGQNLRWIFRAKNVNGDLVDAIDETQDFQARPSYLFDYVAELNTLTSMTPSSGPLENNNGETIIMTGFFSGFDRNNGDILFDNVVIDPDLILWDQSDENRIVFIRPNQSDVGQKASYEVSVRVRDERTNSLPFLFVFEGEFITIMSSGTNFNDFTGMLEICSCCSARFVAVLSNGFIEANPVYSWRVDIDADRDGANYETWLAPPPEVPDADPAAFSQSIFVVTGDEDNELDDLVENAFYRFTVNVDTDIRSGSASVLVSKTSLRRIGVSILTPQKRTPAIPNAQLSVAATIQIPECLEAINNAEFTWTLTTPRGTRRSFLFSSQNSSIILDDSTPTRLGQEIKILQSELYYGITTISLSAIFVNTPVFGFDEISAEIIPSALVATINGGQSFKDLALDEALLLEPIGSFDPDQAFIGFQEGTTVQALSYMWSCQWGTQFRVLDQECTFFDPNTPFLDFIEAPNIDIPADQWAPAVEARMAELGVTEIWIRYKMYVTRDVTVLERDGPVLYERISTETQIKLHVRLGTVELAQINDVILSNVNNTARSLSAVPYWEQSILAPVFDETLENVLWSYSLISPEEELPEAIFAQRAIEVGIPGFRDPQFFSTGDSRPIMFKAGDYPTYGESGYPLTPSTTYEFEILFSSSGTNARPIRIQFQTLERPTINFPPIVLEGFRVYDDTNVISAVATPSFDSSLFAFNFYAKNLDLPGSTYEDACISTCSGEPFVQFRLGISGTYEITAVLTDVTGQAILAEKLNDVTIEIQSSISGNDIDVQLERMRNLYQVGSDGEITVLSTSVLYAIQETVEQLKLSLSLRQTDDEISVQRTEFLREALQIMSQVARLSIPFRGQNLQLTQTSCIYTSLDETSGIFLSDEDLEMLVVLYYLTMQHPPQTIQYDPLVIEQLRCIGNRMQLLLDEAQLRLDSSRRRLLQVEPEPPYQEVRLEFFETFWETVILFQVRGRNCGFESGNFNTVLPSGFGGLAMNMVVKIVCTVDQRLDRYTVAFEDDQYAGSIEICDQAYQSLSGSGVRKDSIVVAAGFLPIYPRDSGVSTEIDEVLSVGLARVSMYRLVGETLEPLSLGFISGCFTFTMKTKEDVRGSILSFDALQFVGLKEFEVPMVQGGGYFERRAAVNVDTLSLGPANSTVTFSTSAQGLFTSSFVSGFRAPIFPTPGVSSTPGPGEGPVTIGAGAITGIIIGSLLLLLLLLLLLFLIFVRIPGSAVPLAAVGAAVPVYVDRDVYGRASMFDLEENEEDDEFDDEDDSSEGSE